MGINKKDNLLKTFGILFLEFFAVNIVISIFGGGGFLVWSMPVSQGVYMLDLLGRGVLTFSHIYGSLMEMAPFLLGLILIAVHVIWRIRWMIVLSFLGFTLWVFSALLIGMHV